MLISKTVKIVSLNAVLILLMTLLMSNTDGSKVKKWDANEKLTWKDYKDTVITGSKRVALTNAGVRLSYKQSEEEVIVVCYSEMNPEKSWVDSTKKSDYILSHEQYHFNIAEYWSRKLKKDISSAHFSKKTFRDKISDMQKQNTLDCKEMQTQYDTETKHSIDKAQQKDWEKKIDDLLKKTEEFIDKTVSVTLK